MIRAVVIVPAYSTEESDLIAQAAMAREIERSYGLRYRSKLQWSDCVVLDLEDDVRPYKDLPVLTMGSYAYIRAKYAGCRNILSMPGPTEAAFETCGAFEKFDQVVGTSLRWGSEYE